MGGRPVGPRRGSRAPPRSAHLHLPHVRLALSSGAVFGSYLRTIITCLAFLLLGRYRTSLKDSFVYTRDEGSWPVPFPPMASLVLRLCCDGVFGNASLLLVASVRSASL